MQLSQLIARWQGQLEERIVAEVIIVAGNELTRAVTLLPVQRQQSIELLAMTSNELFDGRQHMAWAYFVKAR